MLRESPVEAIVGYWTAQYLAFAGHQRQGTQAALHAVLVGLRVHRSVLDLAAWHDLSRTADGELVRSLLPEASEMLVEEICAAARHVRWAEIMDLPF